MSRPKIDDRNKSRIPPCKYLGVCTLDCKGCQVANYESNQLNFTELGTNQP
jgi:hypothetical protein